MSVPTPGEPDSDGDSGVRSSTGGGAAGGGRCVCMSAWTPGRARAAVAVGTVGTPLSSCTGGAARSSAGL